MTYMVFTIICPRTKSLGLFIRMAKVDDGGQLFVINVALKMNIGACAVQLK